MNSADLSAAEWDGSTAENSVETKVAMKAGRMA